MARELRGTSTGSYLLSWDYEQKKTTRAPFNQKVLLIIYILYVGSKTYRYQSTEFKKWPVINHINLVQTNEKKKLLRVLKVETTLPFSDVQGNSRIEKGTFASWAARILV